MMKFKKIKMQKVYFYFLFLLIFSGGFYPITQVLAQKKDVTIEDVWVRHSFYNPSGETYNWMKDDNYYSSYEEEKGIYKVSVKDENDKKLIVPADAFKNSKGEKIKVYNYDFGANETKLLIYSDIKPIYRRSATLTTYVYDIAGKSITTIFGGKAIQLPTLSPDGTKVAFVYENNLYYTDLLNPNESNNTIQVTNDGKKNHIINGTCDWVYEEEFGFVNAFHWSPDSKTIAYYRFDESMVKEFTMQTFGKLYPENVTFKYPKAGEKNAEIEIYCYNLSSKSKIKIDIGTEKDIYIPRIKWTNHSDKLAIMRMNRLQNKLEILIAEAPTGKTQTIVTETDEKYISEVTDQTWIFLTNSDQFIWQSERDGYNHLYLYDLTGKLVRQITKGEWDVSEVYGVSEKDTKDIKLYYLSSEDSPLERYPYCIGIDGKKKTKLAKVKGWHDSNFSSNFSYFIDSYSSTLSPTISTLCKSDGELIKSLTDNKTTLDKISEYNVSPKEFFDFKLNDGTKLNGWMIKPQNFSSSKKYPVIMFVYGGPGHQEVRNAYDSHNFFWYQMLASKGYLIACIDNRGTGARGAKFKKITYGQLGKYETEDQIAGARYLSTLSYVDGNQIGIWGWSYGGYMSSLCLLKGADIFKAAIAVAPVTNWRFYDTIYTERYMGLPSDNASGYDDNSPISHAGKLKGKYLLIHGMADDNVHFQNAVDMTTSLINANKEFDHFFYPNRNHGIGGKNTRYHLYNKMTQFWLNNLKVNN